MLYRVWFYVCLWTALSLSLAHAQDVLIKRLGPSLDPLPKLESLVLLKYAENAITDDLDRMAKSPPPKDREAQRQHVTAFFKRSAFNYRALTLLLERKQFPAIAAIYRTRAELYDDFLQGKLKSPQFEKREDENESAKMRALTEELAALQKIEPLTESRRKSLEELGETVGRGIAMAAMMNATPASSAERTEPTRQPLPAASQQSTASQSAGSAFTRAAAAKRKGDYATVLREIMPLAERGNADAQTVMGSLYDHGHGVPQNPTTAVTWYRRAAEQGNDAGQYYLGIMHGLGKGGLPEDRISSHMWFSLAAAQDNKEAAKARDKIADFMKPAELAESKRRAAEWKPVKTVTP